MALKIRGEKKEEEIVNEFYLHQVGDDILLRCTVPDGGCRNVVRISKDGLYLCNGIKQSDVDFRIEGYSTFGRIRLTEE